MTCLRRTHHLQDGRVAADDERQAPEALDTVSDTHREFFVQVPSAALFCFCLFF